MVWCRKKVKIDDDNNVRIIKVMDTRDWVLSDPYE